VNVRRGGPEDAAVVRAFLDVGADELWQRPWMRDPIGDDFLDDKLVFVAEEEGEPVGCAFGIAKPNATAHLNYLYVRPERRRQGVARELLREFAAAARGEGAEHITLDVDTTNELGRLVWQSLGFTEWAQRLSTPVEALERRLAQERGGESYGSIHVQTDDERTVETAVQKYLPRIGRSAETRVEAPRNGWTPVYDELCSRDPQALRRLAQELSYATGAVVLAIGVEDGAVVRYLLYDRGSIIDEYLSVPEYYGPLPPGDVVGLGANPTVVARLTGAEPAEVRAVARTASSPDELPPAAELLAQIADVMGIEGAVRG
jgi:ribosomal protein S18 acetylase RimI-like enzyme